jgi:DNA polymerase zeta
MDASRAPRLLKFRLNCIDFYQTRPTGFDSVLRPLGNNATQKTEATVPVIRVFGSTDTGQKVCAHIHGAFPYLYIEYHGDLDSSTGQLMRKLVSFS